MTTLRGVPGNGRRDECCILCLCRVEKSLALKFHIALSCNNAARDDGEGARPVLAKFRIGNLGNFGNTTVGGLKDMLGGLPFEFLTDLFDCRFDLIQLMDIGCRGELEFKRPDHFIMIFMTINFTIQRKWTILTGGEHGYPP